MVAIMGTTGHSRLKAPTDQVQTTALGGKVGAASWSTTHLLILHNDLDLGGVILITTGPQQPPPPGLCASYY